MATVVNVAGRSVEVADAVLLNNAPATPQLAVQENLICPPASVMTQSAPVAWFATNYFQAFRFSVKVPGWYRYANFKIGTASGNIEVAVLALSGANGLTYTRVMTTGQIACPAASNIHRDLGRTWLPAGDYALAFWADNVTVTVPNTVDGGSSMAAARISFDPGGTGAIASSGTFASFGNRAMWGFTLEADI